MGQVTVLLLLLGCVLFVVAPPVKEKKPDDQNNEVGDEQYPPEVFSMEYARYLQEVVRALEEDDDFRQKLQNASEDDIKSGKIAHELEFVNHNIRTKLDEIKRQEVERLRRAAREQMELSQGFDRKQIKIPKHLDRHNPHTFEIRDLEKLIHQTTKDLEETDRKRRQEFKEYEMEKERQRLEKLKAMDEEHKTKAQQEYEEQQRKHKEHPKLHHPGSRPQLEEVWEKQDQLPATEFNPKLFFKMHDLDGDNKWSVDEVNALFQNELNKMYDPNAPEDDLRERYEEMERMREHVFNETDKDHDGLISFDEFMVQAKNQEFENDPGWQGLDEQQVYSRDEYEAFERHRQEEMARMAAAGMNPYGNHGGYPSPPHVNPNQMGYQPVPPHAQGNYPQQPQMHPQQGYPQPHGQGPQTGYQQGMHAPYQQEYQHMQQQVPHHPQQQVPQQQVPQQPQKAAPQQAANISPPQLQLPQAKIKEEAPPAAQQARSSESKVPVDEGQKPAA